MRYVYDLWDNFCIMCDKASLLVSRSKDFFFSMMLVNHQAFSSVINIVAALWTSFSSFLSVSSEIIMWLIYGIIEFATEVESCLRMFVVLLWHLLLVFINMIFLVVNAIENFIYLLWNGGVGTVSVLNTSVEILKESWDTACLKGEEFTDLFFLLVIGGFETIGCFVVDIFLYVLKILSSVLNIPYLLRDAIDSCIMMITKTMDYVWINLTYSKEALFGVVVCIFLHIILTQGIKMSRTLNQRGITFPIFRHYYSHTVARFDNDSEISDNEEPGEEEHDSSNVTESDNSDSESVDDSESNESDSIMSETTDSDIDLPNYGDSLQQSRPPTPLINKPLNSTQLEREIERERDKRKCVVCQDHVKTVLILPCKHMCLCVQCANHIVRSSPPDRNVCPLCRTGIQKVMNIYV
ncbi:uncharacterized protein LOC106871024 [Octopus bimaculoides]|uniref:RING-type domain-containing protein n=1 Tax=Octopus bimaculoides TaxID=37653 RepID=A0A0L8IE94_OCTBM|nr:uncharacterized protein LOC106871024 [Octopus bimaculoides]|eukprot:XP_014772772.1 PREDICTED: uncharacterized protein LOC106871024 [Octopus bimaculoides]